MSEITSEPIITPEASAELKKAQARERSRAWRQKNKQRANDYSKQYYQDNQDKLKAYNNTYAKKWYDADPQRRIIQTERCSKTYNKLTDTEKSINRAETNIRRYESKIINTKLKLSLLKNDDGTDDVNSVVNDTEE
tara:strand:+ start:1708 stop:2115 length:408 start_codon:yes stop_codon:yes gene_type:complete